MKTFCGTIAVVSALLLAGEAHGLAPQAINTRRDLFRQIVGTTTGAALVAWQSPAVAASLPSAQDLSRLQKGHARVKYLLDNWDEETKVCGRSIMSDTERKQVIRTNAGGGTDACIRTPLVVQDYLGYKSTNDPLFKVDKLMLQAAPLAGDKQDDFLDIVEAYRENADQTAVLAYTSSWAGEENPNGSAENIENYLEQTRGFAVKTEVLLRKALQYLDLPVLPPSAKP